MKHGTYDGYVTGKCRCDLCGQARREYMVAWRAKRDKEPLSIQGDGTLRKTPLERLLSKIQIGDGADPCWLWARGVEKSGYAVFCVGHKKMHAHRASYQLLVGPIPDGLQLDHLCRVRHCINPDHLEPVTARTNTLRGEGPAAHFARQTECVNGHPFDEANTYHSPRQRVCRACARERARQRRARKKALL